MGEMEVKENISRPHKDLALKMGISGGVLGVISGFILILSGSRISAITGHEESTFILGLLTMILSKEA